MDQALMVQMYRRMVLINTFEAAMIRLFQDGRVPGFTHSCQGQEAVPVGVCAALRPTDRIGATHRGHGHILAKGADPKPMMAEILGRVDGYCKGMSGELHIVDSAVGVVGANGIVGAGIPILTGAALADQLAGNGGVSVTFFGDGATSEGTFAESMNIAANWKLPVIFVCENNHYAEYSAASDTVAGEIWRRSEAYGIPGVQVDGQVVGDVYDVAATAVARARSGEGPTLIEADTYRWHGHVYGEDALIGTYRYRDRAEVKQMRSDRDPIKLHRAVCVGAGVPADDLDAIDTAVRAEVDEAVDFALASPLPAPEQALQHLFA